MGYIRDPKKPGQRFQAEVRLKGHRPITATFDRKSDAKAWIQKTEADIRAGRHQIYAEGGRHTFAEAVERYSKEVPIPTAKRGHLDWWNKELGPLYIKDIRPAIISAKKQKLLNEVNAKGKVRSKSTCNRFLSTLSHLMSVCMKQWEWIGENPVRKIAREREPLERTRFLNPDERQRFLDACKKSSNRHLFVFAVLLLASGCRYNEIRCLKWTDIDLLQGKITIAKTKNGDIHRVPISGLPLKLLREISTRSLSIGYIFPSKNTTHPLEFRRAIRTAIKRAELKNFRPHDCRHSYCSELLSRGMSLGEIGRMLNHRSISTTRRYAHLTESRAASVVSQMTEEIFEGAQ